MRAHPKAYPNGGSEMRTYQDDNIHRIEAQEINRENIFFNIIAFRTRIL